MFCIFRSEDRAADLPVEGVAGVPMQFKLKTLERGDVDGDEAWYVMVTQALLHQIPGVP